MTQNVARRAYSAEQLLALRHSASDEPAIQIEANAEEGAIKDHVVRNARSFGARSSRSFAASDTLHPPSVDSRPYIAPVLCEIDPNNQTLRPGFAALNRHRPSPTPSLKKRKAEQILKDHGSPPGLRVTAGGRIVPSDQSPLCSPRYGYSAIKKNGMLIKFGPNYPFPPSAMAMQKLGLPNGFVAQDPTGRLCQVVDGKFLPVNDVNGIPQLYIAAPNLTGFPTGNMDDAPGATPFDTTIRKQPSQVRDESSTTGAAVKQAALKQPTVSVAMQIQALEKQYTKLEQESRELDKVEVLQRSSMGTKAYNQLIQNRRELVGRMNDIRVSLKALREAKPSAEQSPIQINQQPLPPQFGMPAYPGQPMMPPAAPLPDWSFDGIAPETRGMPPFSAPHMPPELGFFLPPGAIAGPMAPYPPMYGPVPPMYNMMGIPPVDAFGGFMPNVSSMNTQAFHNGSPPAPRSEPVPEASTNNRRPAEDSTSTEKESPRRSRALEIKNPENKSESSQKSALNPMSPSYQPASTTAKASTPTSKAAQPFATSPSPALAEAVRAHNAWIGESVTASAGSQRRLRYESSASSYATADFFPNNPRDHSMRKDSYPASDHRSTDRIRAKEERPSTSSDQPVTPDTECHNPDWNPSIPTAALETVTTPPVEQEHVSAPPGTPENGNVSYKTDPVANRSEMNVSPKSRRPDYLMGIKSVGEVATLGSGIASIALAPGQGQQAEPSDASKNGFNHEATAYMEGFKAGEARLPVGLDKTGLWLDGYCAGLLKSAHTSNVSTSSQQQSTDRAGPSTTGARAAADISKSQPRNSGSQRPAHSIEINTAAMDTLKEAIFSAPNENAILTPDPTGPGVQDMGPPNLGNWAKSHEPVSLAVPDAVLTRMRNGEAAFPERTSSVVQRQAPSSGASAEASQAAMTPSKALGVAMESEHGRLSQERRVVSAQPEGGSPSTYLQRAYPGQRVLSSQLEWKSGSSIAQVAGLATGYFAQYDGTRQRINNSGDRQPLTPVSGNAGMTMYDPAKAMPEKQISTSPTTQTRFIEASMASDEQPCSTPSSPGKRSPAKVKFAQIAGKAGIKVRADSKEENEGEGMSPNEKRRWRDVWKKRFTEGREGGQ